MNIDVIIVNYNAGPLLTKSVQSALNSGVRIVFVIDNNSHDQSISLLETSVSSERVKVIRNNSNKGFAAACNIGALASNSKYLLFLNPDTEVTTGALKRMYTVLESDDSIGMVGGLVCNPDGSEQPGGRRSFPTPRTTFARAFGLTKLAEWFPSIFTDFLLHQDPLPKQPVPVEAISGSCMLVKREAINDVGLWDEDYFLHCEDLDWCMRFHKKNWLVMFVPDAKIIHALGACSKSRPIFVEWHKHRGMLRFYKKFNKQSNLDPTWWLVVIGVWTRFIALSAYLSLRSLLSRLGLTRG